MNTKHKLKGVFFFALLILSLLSFVSCENKKEDESSNDFRSLNSPNVKNKSIEIKSSIENFEISDRLRRGDLYCVVGDSVLVFRSFGGRINDDSNLKRIKEIIFFPMEFGFGKELEQNYTSINLSNPKLKTVSDSYDNLYGINPNFIIIDERNEEHRISLYRLADDSDIEYRRFEERESSWRLRNEEEINEWERNAINGFDTTINYIDFNNKLCSLKSGYKARMLSFPKFKFTFTDYNVYIQSIDTVITLGYPEVIHTSIDSFVVLDLRAFKKFDCICIGFNGLEALAKDRNRNIVATNHPIMLYLEK
jgi:hypothetical protein